MNTWTVLAAAAVLACVGHTSGATIDVTDDTSLRQALRQAAAGDVVRVGPGTYRGGLFAELKGTKDQPITIAGRDAKEPPVVEGGANGLHLSGAQHVTVRDIVFRNARDNGINIDDGGAGQPLASGISVERVTIQDVGPKGNRDGIKLSGLTGFRIVGCVVEGWGGNAIDLVGCSDGVIERCIVRGKEGFDCTTGPQLKGGTRNVVVRHCLFDRAGQRAVNAGGSTGMPFFRPADATYEAKDVTIEHNVFLGSDAPVAFVGVDGAIFRHNTIVDPTRWVLRILQETASGERFVRCRNVTFERNLIVYGASAVRSIANVGPDTSPETFIFKDNWWYCRDATTRRPSLPTAEQGGVVGRDPQLEVKDGWATPRLPDAMAYGAVQADR